MTFGHDALDERRAGYEEGYFRNKDAEMVSKLKGVFDKKHSREELKKLTGVTDEAAIDRLMAVIDRKELLSAFKLYPLVEIAWADGKVDATEVKAIEAAAQKSGIPRDSAAFERLGDWIRKGPTDNARAVWKLYAGQLRTKLTAAELDTFRNDLLKFADSVAESSGGLFGIFKSTSSEEQKVIDTIKKALSA
ncbi:MAG: hypothetical protein FJ253_02235 [Phycisphaerae bacterium]|nr:hypothetical protein [Phycisphaerae bacterium]